MPPSSSAPQHFNDFERVKTTAKKLRKGLGHLQIVDPSRPPPWEKLFPAFEVGEKLPPLS